MCFHRDTGHPPCFQRQQPAEMGLTDVPLDVRSGTDAPDLMPLVIRSWLMGTPIELPTSGTPPGVPRPCAVPRQSPTSLNDD